MTDTIDLAAYQGKRVKFALLPKDADSQDEIVIEGLVELVNGPAMLVKPKGSTMSKLVELSNIKPGSLEIIPEQPREIKAKAHLGTVVSNVRVHLTERHGMRLSVVNAMSDIEAYEMHAELSHEDLGHYHAKRSEQNNSQ